VPPNILTIPPGGHEAGRRESYIKTLLCAQHVALVKSASDANMYLVSDASDPLQRSLMDLELKDHLLATAAPHAPMPGEVFSYCGLRRCRDFLRKLRRVANWRMDLELKDHLLASAAPHAPMPGELCETHHSTRTAVELEGQEPPAGLRSDARAHAW